ncbi:hypothetical protein BASA61_008095 [Batrachochytrium salamandrivorans]|nr:hypothetical protein BASA61_008095 [Batrachochytrium salamandrivorans]
MEHVSKIDRRTTKHGARFRITVPEDRQRNIIQRLERQSKQTHWRIRQNYRHRRPDQPRPTAPPPPLSRQILAVNVANISNKRPAIRHIVRNTRLWAISETCITSSKFRFTVPGFDVIQHPATGPGRRGIALGIPSCFGGHEHGSAVGTMILAKVPNFLEFYFGHGGAEQFVRGQYIQRLNRCAVTLLFGCSSGYMMPAGEFEPQGTPLHYLLAGCPSLVANLWDVTDRDIDRYSKSMMERWGLLQGDSEQDPVTLPMAVSMAREDTLLKYLIGAAPVLYGGLPINIQK